MQSVHTAHVPSVQQQQQQRAAVGKENGTGMYGGSALSGGGYFGVTQQPPSLAGLHLHSQPQAYHAPHAAHKHAPTVGLAMGHAQTGAPRSSAAAAAAASSDVSNSRNRKSGDEWRRTGSAPTRAPGVVAPAPPFVRELAAHHNSNVSNSLLKEVAAMRRAAAAAAANASNSATGAAQQQAAAAAAAGLKKPAPPAESRASRPVTSAGSSAALGSASNPAMRRRAGANLASGPSGGGAVPTASGNHAQFDQFSLWNDAEPNAQEWVRRQQQAAATGAPSSVPSSGRSHQLYPQAGSAAAGVAAAQPFSARPDANFAHYGSGSSAHAAAVRAETRAAAKQQQQQQHDGVPAGATLAEATRANERVEKRFEYWKNFWSNIQQLRAKQGVPLSAIPLPDMDAAARVFADVGVSSPVQAQQQQSTGPAGFGMNIGGGGVGSSKHTGHSANNAHAPSAAQLSQLHASMLGMDEQSFREAMAEFGDLPADVDISHSIDSPPAGTTAHAQQQRHATATAAAAAAAQGRLSHGQAHAFVPSYERTSSVPTSGSHVTNAGAAPTAAQLAFQQYQQQFASASPSKAPAAANRQQDRPPSASKQQAAAAAATAAAKLAQEKAKQENAQAAAAAAAASAAAAAASAAAAATAAAAAGAGSDPSGAAAAAAAAEAERKRQSNVERFWAEEQARKLKPRGAHGAGGPGGGSKPRSKAHKAAANFVAPADPKDARAMWEKMKADLDSKWNKFQGDGPEHREEKQHASNGGDGSAQAQGDAEPPRSSAYAFTNICKEDLKYHAAPAAAAGAPSGAAAAGSGASAKPTTGAQFSSFSRPPQPHTSSSTAYSSGGASGAGGGSGSAGQGGLYDVYSRWSVRELRRELLGAGVAALDLSRLVEKDELVVRLVAVQAEAARKAEARRQAALAEAAAEESKERIVHEVDRWAKGRHIKSMLNELNGFHSVDTTGYLKRTDTLVEVSRAYKKALLKIHPDKHMDSQTKHWRATEVFKYVSQAFADYKKKYEK